MLETLTKLEINYRFVLKFLIPPAFDVYDVFGVYK